MTAEYETREDGTRVVHRPHWRDLPTSDPDTWRKQFRSMYEYMLLSQARDRKEVPAAELLFIFERYGKFHNEEVQEAVLSGAREIAGYAARMAMRPSERLRKEHLNGSTQDKEATIGPLKFFLGVEAEKRGPKQDQSRRLELLAVYGGSPVTPEVALKVLCKIKPQRVHHAETALSKYLEKLYPDSSPSARSYIIRSDLSEINWEDGDEPFIAPEGWP